MNLNYEKFVYNQSKNLEIDDKAKQKSSSGMLARKQSNNSSQYSNIPAYRVEIYRREIEKQNLKKQGIENAEATA